MQEAEDITFIPTTNLAETKHASWLAGEGYKQILSLYDACVSDLANALLQSVKMLAFIEGRYHGAGPSAEKLAQRMARGHAPMPSSIVREVDMTIGGTPIHQQPTQQGDNITISKKRKTQGPILTEEENASHRPEYLVHNVSRQKRCKKNEQSEPISLVNAEEAEFIAEETDIHKTMWAIRRIPKGSRVQCQGWLGGHIGKCKKNIKNIGNGVPAPCFWGIRTWDVGNDGQGQQGSKAQFMWFCNDNVDHTWRICNSITHFPARVPTTWPIETGTNLSNNEFNILEHAGFKLQKRKAEEPLASVRYRSGISVPAAKRIDSAITMEAQVEGHDVIKHGLHEKFQLSTSSSQVRDEVYEVHISRNPMCTCRDFADRAAQGRPYLACKHIYYIFLRVFGLDVNHNMFIHQPKLTNDDLGRVFNARRTL